MDEQPSKPVPAKGKDQSFKDEQEKARINLGRIHEYEQQLLNNTRFMEYAAAFSKHSVESFIKDFASKKVRWMEWGAKYAAWKEKDDLEWQERAMDMLKEIQQKKLFDLQCRWRAEKIKLPGIEICYDFVCWERNILACPFLEPVTDEEAEMYLSYLSSDNYTLMGESWQWQDYDAIKDAYNNNDSDIPYPEWYSFCDSRMGTSAYLLLSDIRGDKERFYISIARQKEKKSNAAPGTTVPVTAGEAAVKPSLEYHEEGFMKWFVKTFDTPDTYRFFKAMDDTTRHNKEDVDEMVSILSRAENIIPIRKSKNYEEGIMGAAAELIRQKCLRVFPIVFQEYKMYIENNLRSKGEINMMSFIFALSNLHRQVILKDILRGRVLNGEPENLDF